MDRLEEAKALAEEFSTAARKLVPSPDGKTIFAPLLADKQLLDLRFKELQIQRAVKAALTAALQSKVFIDPEEALTQACLETGIDREWARNYFASPRYKKWFVDRMEEISANLGLSIEYLALKHKQNIEGDIKLTSGQLESLKELGDRFWPKISRIEHQVETKQSTTLDDLPDFQRRVDELEEKLRSSIPTEGLFDPGT